MIIRFYKGYNYVQLAIDYGFASSLYSLHYIYYSCIYLSIYSYFRSIHMSRGWILNATILKIYLEITIYDETRVLQQGYYKKDSNRHCEKLIEFGFVGLYIEKNLVINFSLSFILVRNVNKPKPKPLPFLWPLIEYWAEYIDVLYKYTIHVVCIITYLISM